MKVTVKVDFDSAKIMRQRGMGGSNELRKYLASEVWRLSDPYTPMDQGDLKNRHTIAKDGSSLVYTQPYAHYQYYGKVMGPNYETAKGWRSGKAPKHYTGADLTYQGAPMRGPRWVERMMADKRGDLEKSVEAWLRRK